MTRKIRGRMIKLTHADRLAKEERNRRKPSGKSRAVRIWAREHIKGIR